MIEVMAAGMHTSIQDEGRSGFRRYGVPLSGVMDAFSARLANKLLGNESRMAVLECTLQGPKLFFHEATEIAICGGLYRPVLNNVSVPMNQLITVAKGSELVFGSPSKGMRAYLAVKGGFDTTKVMGSRSMYGSITENARLQKGDILPIHELHHRLTGSNALIKNIQFDSGTKVIDVFEGPEFTVLSKDLKAQLFNCELKVSAESNRMGIKLDGLTVTSVNEIITAPVQPGTVQLTPSGTCIVLMRDAQTTGGYARIFQLSDAAIDILAQKRPGELVSFRSVKFN